MIKISIFIVNNVIDSILTLYCDMEQGSRRNLLEVLNILHNLSNHCLCRPKILAEE